MPIAGRGWEMHVVRTGEQHRSGKTRTVGRYQVYRDGSPVPGLSGLTAEPGGPGDNATADCGLRVEPGVYALATHDGDSYCSIGYIVDASHRVLRKPALRLDATGVRTDILVHPGHDFLASLGCLNPAGDLATGDTDICFDDSRRRVIALINDLERYAGDAYPRHNDHGIAQASVVIEEEAA